MYYVYILRSLKNNRFYIGHTSDVQKRLSEHNRGKTRSTKGHTPYELIYTEEFDNKSKAYLREMALKKIKKRSILDDLIAERWQSG